MAAAQPSPEIVQEVVLNAHGNFARVRELVEGDPTLINVSAPWDETPIQAASHMGNREIAQWLLERGAPLDVFTAAMLGRRPEVERFLREDPSLVGARGVHGMPILFFPAASGEVEIAQLLVDRGADVNAGAGGNTPLHATAHLNRAEMARWLIERGADPAAADYEGQTPLQRAESAGHEEVAAVLREAGAQG